MSYEPTKHLFVTFPLDINKGHYWTLRCLYKWLFSSLNRIRNGPMDEGPSHPKDFELSWKKRPSYQIFARSWCIWISFLNWNLRISGFCHASARLGKAMLYSKVYRFVGCLLSFSEKLKGCPLFICNWVGQSEPALIFCHVQECFVAPNKTACILSIRSRVLLGRENDAKTVRTRPDTRH